MLLFSISTQIKLKHSLSGSQIQGVFWFFFGYDSDDICPAAQIGHYHVNRGPQMPSGVTLATVKAIVPLCV